MLLMVRFQRVERRLRYVDDIIAVNGETTSGDDTSRITHVESGRYELCWLGVWRNTKTPLRLALSDLKPLPCSDEVIELAAVVGKRVRARAMQQRLVRVTRPIRTFSDFKDVAIHEREGFSVVMLHVVENVCFGTSVEHVFAGKWLLRPCRRS